MRAVIRVPDSEKWKADEIQKLRATPKRPNPFNEEQKETKSMRQTKGIEIEGDASKLAETPAQEVGETRARNFRITYEIL